MQGRFIDILQTGFSQGEPSISNDDELAAQVAGFLEQFLEVFGELKGSNFFVSGESVSVYSTTLDSSGYVLTTYHRSMLDTVSSAWCKLRRSD